MGACKKAFMDDRCPMYDDNDLLNDIYSKTL